MENEKIAEFIIEKFKHPEKRTRKQQIYRFILWIGILLFMFYWMDIWKENDYIRYYQPYVNNAYVCNEYPPYCNLSMFNDFSETNISVVQGIIKEKMQEEFKWQDKIKPYFIYSALLVILLLLLYLLKII